MYTYGPPPRPPPPAYLHLHAYMSTTTPTSRNPATSQPTAAHPPVSRSVPPPHACCVLHACMSVSSADSINAANWTTTEQLPNPPAYKHAFLVLDPGLNPEINPKAGFWASSTHPEPSPALAEIRTTLEAYRCARRERGRRGAGLRDAGVWKKEGSRGKKSKQGLKRRNGQKQRSIQGGAKGIQSRGGSQGVFQVGGFQGKGEADTP